MKTLLRFFLQWFFHPTSPPLSRALRARNAEKVSKMSDPGTPKSLQNSLGSLRSVSGIYQRVPPCAVKTCAVRPVFARVVGELRAADPSNVHGPVKQNASPGEQSEAPRPRWKPGQGQNPGPEIQDNQHMLEQPRGYFPEESVLGLSANLRRCRLFN